MGRRQVLRAVGAGAAALGLAACSEPSSSTSTAPGTTAPNTTPGTTAPGGAATLGEIPDETAGPYPGNGSNGPDVLEQSGIVRSDIRTSLGDTDGVADGVPMTLELTVKDLANGGVAFAGVAVYVWHCDRAGRYSMYSDGVTAENYLRGVQITGAGGEVTFTSIFPACYPGRWPHVHFEVYPDRASITDAAEVIATSQVAIPREYCDTVYQQTGYAQSVGNLARLSLESDNVFGDDGAASQLASVTGDVSNGYTVALSVGVDTRTAPATGGGPAGGGPAGGGPAGGDPGQPGR